MLIIIVPLLILLVVALLFIAHLFDTIARRDEDEDFFLDLINSQTKTIDRMRAALPSTYFIDEGEAP